MKRAWICLTRIPEPGRTKTRLMPFLTGEECAMLHTAFLCDIAETAQEVAADLFVAHTPGDGWEMLQEIFPMACGFFPQEGEDLGERMHNAMRKVLSSGYDVCILTGADMPGISEEHIESGFRALAEADVALGPTMDGGYYLVGLKQPCRALFEKQTYGVSTVFEATLAAAERAGCRVEQAIPCGDVDTPEELHALWEQCRGTASHTALCLGKIFEKVGRI